MKALLGSYKIFIAFIVAVFISLITFSCASTKESELSEPVEVEAIVDEEEIKESEPIPEQVFDQYVIETTKWFDVENLKEWEAISVLEVTRLDVQSVYIEVKSDIDLFKIRNMRGVFSIKKIQTER